MTLRRLHQVIKYGWTHAGELSMTRGYSRIRVFSDILYCFVKYKMWSNQYLDENFYALPIERRKEIGSRYAQNGRVRDKWQTDFNNNRKFLIKYSNIRYEARSLRDKRNKAYAARFNAGDGLLVEYGVNISRQHYLDGSIKIGRNVLLAKNVFIDYSGNVVIEDNVQLTNGVIIETHHHPFHSYYDKPRNIALPTQLLIRSGAVIGSRAIIMPTCSYIGLHARVGAGAVVTKDVPDYAVVVGVPAKVIRIQEH